MDAILPETNLVRVPIIVPEVSQTIGLIAEPRQPYTPGLAALLAAGEAQGQELMAE